MNLFDAKRRAKDGRNMARIGWPSGQYIWWNTGYDEPWLNIEHQEHACPLAGSLTDEDARATDWIDVTGLTTTAKPSLLEGFRNTPPDMYGGRAARVIAVDEAQYVPVQLGTPAPSFTRFNGDGTWRVVRGGETRATGFDNEGEAAAWIENNP